MKKQFANHEELDAYCMDYEKAHFETKDPFWYFKTTEAQMRQLTDQLVSDGYDLDDLVADKHLYTLCGHTNNGWLYRDEIDPMAQNVTCEIRDRRRKYPVDLKALRLTAALSQQALADRAGMNISQVQKLECGSAKIENIKLKTAFALAAALDVDVNDLM